MPIKLMKRLPSPPVEVYDVHVKLDPDSYTQVLGMAQAEDRPLSSMVRRIVSLWLQGISRHMHEMGTK